MCRLRCNMRIACQTSIVSNIWTISGTITKVLEAIIQNFLCQLCLEKDGGRFHWDMRSTEYRWERPETPQQLPTVLDISWYTWVFSFPYHCWSNNDCNEGNFLSLPCIDGTIFLASRLLWSIIKAGAWWSAQNPICSPTRPGQAQYQRWETWRQPRENRAISMANTSWYCRRHHPLTSNTHLVFKLIPHSVGGVYYFCKPGPSNASMMHIKRCRVKISIELLYWAYICNQAA